MHAQKHELVDLELDWITEDIRANFGEVTALHEDSLGIIWMGINGKGLALYNGKEIRRIPIEDEEIFANESDIFHPLGNTLFLNCERSVKVFDAISQEVESIIKLDDVDKHIVHLLPQQKGDDAFVWALASSEDKKAISTYEIYLSKGLKPFELFHDKKLTTIEQPILKFFSNNDFLLKSDTTLLRMDQHHNIVQQYNLDVDILSAITNQNIIIDHSDRIFFTGQCQEAIKAPFPCKIGQIHRDGQITYFDMHTMRSNLKTDAKNRRYLKTINLLDNFLIADGYALDLRLNQEPVELSEFFRAAHVKTRAGHLFSGSIDGLTSFKSKSDCFKIIPSFASRSMAELPNGLIIGTQSKTPRYREITTNALDTQKDSVFVHPFLDLTDVIFYNFQQLGNDIFFIHKKVDVRNGDIQEYPQMIEDFQTTPVLTLADRKGRIWKANWGQSLIVIYNAQTGERYSTTILKALQSTNAELNDWYQQPSTGNVWLGTFGQGIFILSEEGQLLHHLTRDSESKVRLNNMHVCGFHEDEKGNMWLAHGAGLSKIDKNFQSIAHFTLNPDHPEERIFYSILPDDDPNYLWISTSQGIFRFDIHASTFMDFSLHEDVMSQEYNRTSYLKTRNGEMYFGSTFDNNITVRFHPKDVIDYYEQLDRSHARIFLDRLTIYNEDNNEPIVQTRNLNNQKEIVLNPDVRYFELQYLLTDYSASDKIKYRHQLKNYDQQWSKATIDNNVVRYENLKPGKYELHLAAGLLTDESKQTVKTISINVLPAWYQTWWSKVLLAAIVLLLLYSLYRYNLQQQFDRQESKRIQELDQLKTRLYTNITHEFRTPLTVILGMTENISAHEKEKLLIQNNANDLLTLINQLLDLAKLESGELKLNLTKGDIIGYVKYLVQSFFSLASNKRIKLQFEANCDYALMEYDEQKIQHVVYNLISNAIKFTRSGGKVFCFIEVDEDNLVFSVKDTGIGIPPADLQHVFDRFYQVTNTNTAGQEKETYEGTGIGLALTKELIELMGGQIEVKSQVNWGSEFIASLPLKLYETNKQLVKSENSLRHESATRISPMDEINGNKPLILLIEDNDGVATYIKSILADSYQVQWAINGSEGIALAIEQIPDVIISDVMMPEKNGYEVCDALKNDERTSHIPIIMLTAKADFESKLVGLHKGADAYLYKPFEKRELLIRISNLLDLRSKLQSYFAIKLDAVHTNQAEGTDQAEEIHNQDPFIEKIQAVIVENLANEDLSVQFLSTTLGLSHNQMYRKIKALTGMTAVQFINSVRMKKALFLLENEELNVAEVAYMTGFSDPSYFTRLFKKEFGTNPTDKMKK